MPLQAIKAALGSPPFFKEEDGQAQQNGASEEGSKTEGSATTSKGQQASHRPAVLADGSYASQTALTDTFTMPSMASNSPLNLRWVTHCSESAGLVWGAGDVHSTWQASLGMPIVAVKPPRNLIPHEGA